MNDDLMSPAAVEKVFGACKGRDLAMVPPAANTLEYFTRGPISKVEVLEHHGLGHQELRIELAWEAIRDFHDEDWQQPWEEQVSPVVWNVCAENIRISGDGKILFTEGEGPHKRIFRILPPGDNISRPW